MTRLPAFALLVTMAIAGVWAARALNDWEWTRALWMTMAFVAAEIAFFGVITLARLRTLHQPTGEVARAPLDQRYDRLVTADPKPERFAWLDESSMRFNVFATVVVGGGALISGVLWVVDRIASRSLRHGHARELAHQLAALEFPPTLVPAETRLLALDPTDPERTDLTFVAGDRRVE